MPVSLYYTPNNVSKIYLHTGNMLCFSSLINQVHLKNTEQITECLKICFGKLNQLPEVVDNVLQIKLIDLVNQSEEEKESLQTSLKVFISSDDVSALNEALDYTLNDLKLPEINTVILSYNQKTGYGGNLVKDLLYAWRIMERFALKGFVSSLGISDIELPVLKELFDTVEVKPSVVQIKLDICCVVPTDMQDFCNENNIRILTHNDPADILPIASLEEFFTNEDGVVYPLFSKLRVSWVTRLLSHIRCRGILSNKGYIISLDTVS